MLRLRLLTAALFATAVIAAHAQAVDVHATFAYTHVGTAAVTVTPVTGITDTYTPAGNYNAVGVAVGGTFNFIDGKTQQLGIDVRETIAPSSTSGVFMTLAGLRYSAFPRHARFRPYVEVGGGVLVERQPVTTTDIITTGFITRTVRTDNESSLHGAFEGLVGVDTKVNSRMSIRAEFGGGHAGDTTQNNGPAGGALVTVNAGVVFHFD